MAQSEQPKSAREIFEHSLDLGSAEERAAYVNEACGSDAVLLQRVQALVQANEVGDSFLPDQPERSASCAAVERAGDQIGRYKLLEQIGEGGMGVVYMAEQEEPVRRKVALKIIKLGMDTRQVLARFETERQALALMDHPHIAKVLDGGATETGRPYFVMELIQGVPITEFCDKNQLSAEERIKLFIPVCQAIQSAHQKAIIHRDIKPSNVLVSLDAGVPHPMVIDFGVAKATNQKLTEKTLFTNFGTMIGTPAYMSPEQAEMSKLDVDTRSDIYSLGVLLYELLTGTQPFPEKRLRNMAYSEMQRIIIEEEPERPSTRLKKTGLASQLVPHLSPLDSDLDWIVMKCLEKDRNRRYETANGLAADIQAHLKKEQVTACPPSVAYRLRKLVRRNRLVVSASAVVVFALLASVAVSSWQAIRANREKARAERRLTATLKFVEIVFSGVSDKLQNVIGGATANEILNTNGFLLMEELQREAGGNPQFDLTLGKLYTQMAFGQGWFGGNTSGNYDAAFNAATQAIHLFVSLGTAVDSEERARRLARAEMVAGYAAMALRRYDQAHEHFLQMEKWATDLARSVKPALAAEGRKLRRWAFGSVGEALEHLGQTEKAIREYYLPFMLELQGRNVSEETKNWTDLHDFVAASSSLGRAYNSVGQFNEASRYLRQAHHMLGLMTRLFPNDAQVAVEHALAEAELGRFLLAQGSDEGLKHLESATKSINSLVEQDRANINFVEHQIKIARLCALGFAEWSADASPSVIDRQKRANNAQLHLEHAEALLKALRPQSLRNTLDAQLEDVRMKVAAAKAKLGPIDGVPSETPRGAK